MSKRVIIALMDGVRPDAITQIRHPFFEKLTREGCFCMTGRTVAPPRAFPAHISLFTSVDPGKHGIVTNDIRPFPSNFSGLMQILREAGKQTAAVVIWEQLCSVGRSEDINRLDYCDARELENLSPEEAKQVQDRWVDRAADIIRKEEFDFLFFQYEMADTVGHRYGWMSGEYLEAVGYTADAMARLYEALGPEDQFILLSDHGGHGVDHFDPEAAEDMAVPMFCAGSLFPAGKEERDWSLLDIAPTVCKCLDVEIPAKFVGKSLI